MSILVGLLLVLILGVLFVLPVWALVRTARLRGLEERIEGLEAALLRLIREGEPGTGAVPAPAVAPPPPIEQEPPPAQEVAAPPAPPPPVIPRERPPFPAPRPPEQSLEKIIGERWLGWAGILMLIFAAAFGLKYAFENRWIGELGRVMIGLAAGLGFVWYGKRRYEAGWGRFSQVLTAGGVSLLFLSVYASYGFYRLLEPAAAFAFLVVIVATAHLLAVFYAAPAIALMAQIGGFLTPLLLSTGRDRWAVLFSWMLLLNTAAAGVCARRRWRWISSVSFLLSHSLFWGWHGEHYHPEKLAAAIGFQLLLFALFTAADLDALRRGTGGAEQRVRLFVNPLVFFGAAYALLEPQYPQWMGALALALAAIEAGLAKTAIEGRMERAVAPTLIAVSACFVTLTIPIQLGGSWITLGWAAEAAALAWLASRLGSLKLQGASAAVFALALGRHLIDDLPWGYRALFTPVANEYFLTAAALIALLLAAAKLLGSVRTRLRLACALAAAALAWLTMTAETYSYFDALVRALPTESSYAARAALRWRGQMIVSLLWSAYAAGFVAAGLSGASRLLRSAGLVVFGATVLKAFFVDIPALEGFYRFIALFALGLLLLGAAWGYQKIAAGRAGAEGVEEKESR